PAVLGNAETLREFLADLNIYERKNTVIHQHWLHQLQSIVKTEIHLLDWLFRDQLKRGTRLTLYLEPHYFNHAGELYRFGTLIAHILPFCFTQNTFLKVAITNQQTQEIW